MIPSTSSEADRRFADIVVLLSIVYLALITWSHLSAASGTPIWKSYLAVLTAMFLALATLTRQPYWAASFRLLTGAWIVAAPHLLAFMAPGPLSQRYLMVGGLIVGVSVPAFSGFLVRRDDTPRVVLVRNVRVTHGATSPST